ncbi:hypothetical protein EMIT0P260_140095 [Pseudomonas sp. IT-P260]
MPGTVKAEVATGSTSGAFKPALRDTLSQLKKQISETSISASAVWQITRACVSMYYDNAVCTSHPRAKQLSLTVDNGFVMFQSP